MDKKLSKIASILGKKGGQESARKRFAGMTDEEISEAMSYVRTTKYTEEDRKEIREMAQEFVDNLNKNVKEQSSKQ